MATTYELIAKVVLGSSAATIDFASIPSTHDDLLLLVSERNDNASGGASGYALRCNINGVSTNRSWRRLLGYYGGGSAKAISDTSTTANIGISPAADVTGNTFSSHEIYFANYAGSTNKSFSSSFVSENNSATSFALGAMACLWSSTAAITQLTLYPDSGNFVSGSTAYLYGITKS